MGLVFLVVTCIVAFVLACIIMGSSRPLRADPRRAARGVGVSSDRPVGAVPPTERLWFKLAGTSIGPAAVFAFLVLLVRNVQNSVAWNDPSWALILPFGLILALILLSRAKWEWAPVIDGAPVRPPWHIVWAKATAKFLTLIVSGVVICEMIAISLEIWPVLNTALENTGLKHFAAALQRNTQVQIGGLAVLFVLLCWRTNTVTRPEYVRPDGTPIPPPGAGASAWMPPRPEAVREIQRYVPRGGITFWKLALTGLLIGAIWFFAADQIRALLKRIDAPVKFGSVAPSPSTTQSTSGARQTISWPPTAASQPPSLPTATAFLTLSPQYVQPTKAAGYNLFPRVTIIPPGEWVNVYWPDAVYKDGSSWKYVYFRGGNVTVEDCITKARVPLRGRTTQDTNGPNLSCQPMHVFVDSQSYSFFYSLP